MLDSALCQQVSSTRLWTFLSRTLNFLLSHRSGLVVLAVLLLMGLFWGLRQNRWKRSAIATTAFLLITYLTLTSPFVTGIGNRLLTRSLPPDSGENAGAIVVLGRGYQQNAVRAQAVADLWQAQRAPLIFPSGRKDAPIIAQMLRSQAIPASAIAGEPCSLTTDQNAEFTAATLWPQGVRKIILVTDPPHMLRSLLTFESFGFEVIPHTVPLDAETDNVKKRFLVFRESLGLVSYKLMGRYTSREVPPASIIDSDSGQPSSKML